MFAWLTKAYEGAKRVLGKVRTGIESGARIFNKGKEMYNSAKGFASNLPFVGGAASEMIGKAEGQANQYVKSKTGLNFQDVNRAISAAEGVSKYLPTG